MAFEYVRIPEGFQKREREKKRIKIEDRCRVASQSGRFSSYRDHVSPTPDKQSLLNQDR